MVPWRSLKLSVINDHDFSFLSTPRMGSGTIFDNLLLAMAVVSRTAK